MDQRQRRIQESKDRLQQLRQQILQSRAERDKEQQNALTGSAKVNHANATANGLSLNNNVMKADTQSKTNGLSKPTTVNNSRTPLNASSNWSVKDTKPEPAFAPPRVGVYSFATNKLEIQKQSNNEQLGFGTQKVDSPLVRVTGFGAIDSQPKNEAPVAAKQTQPRFVFGDIHMQQPPMLGFGLTAENNMQHCQNFTQTPPFCSRESRRWICRVLEHSYFDFRKKILS